MSDNGNTDPGNTNPNPTPPEGGGMNDSLESLPASWQKHIKELRSEGQNKGARISALENELATEKQNATTRDATQSQAVTDAQMELARYRAAVNSGVPRESVDDIAGRLRGSTADELASDAANLARLFQANPGNADPSNNGARHGVDPSQGRGNGDPAPVKPADQLAAHLRGILGRE